MVSLTLRPASPVSGNPGKSDSALDSDMTPFPPPAEISTVETVLNSLTITLMGTTRQEAVGLGPSLRRKLLANLEHACNRVVRRWIRYAW